MNKIVTKIATVAMMLLIAGGIAVTSLGSGSVPTASANYGWHDDDDNDCYRRGRCGFRHYRFNRCNFRYTRYNRCGYGCGGYGSYYGYPYYGSFSGCGY